MVSEKGANTKLLVGDLVIHYGSLRQSQDESAQFQSILQDIDL